MEKQISESRIKFNDFFYNQSISTQNATCQLEKDLDNILVEYVENKK